MMLIRMQNFSWAYVGVAILLLGGCKPHGTRDNTDTQQSETQPPPAAAFPSNADAITQLSPLGKIEGVAALEDLPAELNPEPFSEAITYAKNTDSYALLIWQAGALRVEKYFDGYDASLKPNSASMHKSVAGLLVSAALADGVIDNINTPIKTYVHEWKNDPRGDIRVVDLLTMTSGLEGLSFAGGPSSPGARYVTNGANARKATLSMKLEHRPGSTFQYVNAVTQILVMVLEEATGKPYSEYLSERLWKPMGGDDAYVWLNEPDGFARGYSALLARAQDWVKLGLLYKDLGRINAQQIIPSEIMAQATAPSQQNVNYGWQIWRGQEYRPKRYYNSAKAGIAVSATAPFAVDDLLFFDGFGGQRVYISREKDLVIVRLGETRLDWDDAVLPNLVLEALDD